MTSSSTACIVALRCLVSGHQLPGVPEVWAVWTMLDNALESQCNGLEIGRLESAVWVLLCASCGGKHGAPPVQSVLAHKILTPHACANAAHPAQRGSGGQRRELQAVCVCGVLRPALFLGPLCGSVLSPEKCFTHSCGEMCPSPSPCLSVPAGFMSPK